MMLMVTVALGPAVASLPHADAATKPRAQFANCTDMNKVYPHGIAAQHGAVDKVRAGSKRVTNYVVNAKLYAQYKRLDRDGDKIACEKL